MNDGKALLRAIIADPADDAVRLVYADWLDEHGDPERAEFIRVQIHLARELGRANSPWYAVANHIREAIPAGRPDLLALAVREGELLAANREWWTAELPANVSVDGFVRGFPTKLSALWSEFVEHGETLLSRTPVEWVEICRLTEPIEPVSGSADPIRWTDPGPAVAALAACSHLARVRRLSLHWAGLTSWQLATLLQSPHFPELLGLDVSGNRIEHGGLHAIAICARMHRLQTLRCISVGSNWMGVHELARSPHLGQLRELDLSSNRFGTAGVAGFAGRPAWPSLERLSLDGNDIQADGLARLGNTHLPRLADLAVSGNGLGDEASLILTRWAVASQLTVLNLSRNNLTPAGVRVLAESSAFANLRELHLSATLRTPQQIGPEGGVALGHSRLAALRSLSLRCAGLGDAGLAGLALGPALSELEFLSVSFNGIGPAGARALASADKLGRLRELSISDNPIGPSGMAALADSPHLLNLRSISIQKCELGDEGVVALMRAAWFVNLGELDLRYNGLTDRTVIALAEHPHLRRLVRLDLSHNQIGDAGCQALAVSPHLDGLEQLDLGYNPAITAAGRRPLWQLYGHRLAFGGHTREQDET